MTTSNIARPLKVLIVEDDENDALLLVDSLEQGGFVPDWHRVDDEMSMRDAITERWDIVLSDYSIPGFSGPGALAILRAQDQDTPFIFISGTIGEDVAVDAMRAGAQDYVMKGNSQRLIPTIERELKEARLKRARHKASEMLRKLSMAVQQSADSICITDRDGKVEYVNPAFEAMTGYSFNEVKDKSPLIFLKKSGGERTPDDLVGELGGDVNEDATSEPIWESAFPRTERATFSSYRRDGELYYEERVATPLLNRSGEVTNFIFSSRDITAKVMAEEYSERLSGLLEETPDVVFIVYPNLKFWYLNRAAYKALDIEASVPIAKISVGDLFPKSFEKILMDVVKHKSESWCGETIFSGCGHQESPYSVVVLSHESDDGALKYLSVIARDISERKHFESELQFKATHDELTSLPNRFLLLDRFNAALQQARRRQNHLAILFIDLDNFKRINDSFGHAAGDAFLVQVASRLKRCLRPNDTVARHGGDEFTILLSDITKPENVLSVIKKLQKELSYPVFIEGNEIFATFSTGISFYPNDGIYAEELLRHADTAMYKAKQTGVNQYMFYAPAMNARSRDIIKLESDMRRAVDQHEFCLYFQPQIDVNSNKTVGFEALIRWQHSERGLLTPGAFVSLLESSGLIISVGDWVLHEACKHYRKMVSKGAGDIRISVNVSATQFSDELFLEKVQRTLAEEGMPADKLELEITETVAMLDPDATVGTLTKLRALGVGCAIDDFGTGYSSLSYLKQFPINQIKIDQSFVRDLQSNKEDSAIIEASVALGQKLNLEVIAEGVETQSQLDILKSCSCNLVQGFHMGKPMPADSALEWVDVSL